jgi:hypothetical protein
MGQFYRQRSRKVSMVMSLNLSMGVFSLPSNDHILLRANVFLISHFNFNAGYRLYLSVRVITPKHTSQAAARQPKSSHCWMSAIYYSHLSLFPLSNL